jgi:hypothetical protein
MIKTPTPNSDRPRSDEEIAMPTDATFQDAAIPAQSVETSSSRGLPAGAGLALAVLLGSVIWIGIFALLM